MKSKLNKGRIIKIIANNYLQVLVVCLAFLIMGFVSFFYVADIVNRQMYDISDQTMKTTITKVDDILGATELLFSNVARTTNSMINDNKSLDEILEYFKGIQEYYSSENNPDTPLPEFMKIYGFIDNRFLDGSGWVPPAEYDATQRP